MRVPRRAPSISFANILSEAIETTLLLINTRLWPPNTQRPLVGQKP
jgi:hypothetical protein